MLANLKGPYGLGTDVYAPQVHGCQVVIKLLFPQGLSYQLLNDCN